MELSDIHSEQRAMWLFGLQFKILFELLDKKGIITTDELVEAVAKEAGVSVKELEKLVMEINLKKV